MDLERFERMLDKVFYYFLTAGPAALVVAVTIKIIGSN